jgi:Asp-tRNA(Asn)/Glu-tRNA(Gln) amidotransferase B subunit
VDYRNGVDASGNFLVGQAMKKTRGKSDPRVLNRLFLKAVRNKEA